MSALVAPERASPDSRQDEPSSVFGTLTSRVLAASGIVMLGFVFVHLADNLLAFAGSAAFNDYYRAIRQLGAPLIGEGTLILVVRMVLASTLTLHLAAHGYRLWRPDDAPVSSKNLAPWYATLPASVLQASGGAIALFLALHIAQLTIGAAHPAFVADDPYRNMLVALRSWPTTIVYVAAAAAVGVHLLPGIWTSMQSLGLIRPQTERLAAALSPVLALALAIGFALVPLAVLIGVVG